MDSSDKVVLGYWPIRGLAQPIRFFLNFLGIAFEDRQYSDRAEWFEKMKPSFNTKLANLPYLQIGDQIYFESDSLFYAAAGKANRLDTIGKDINAMIKVSTLVARLVYDKANFEVNKAPYLSTIKNKFALLDEILSRHKWLAGDDITYVDFLAWEYVDELLVLDKSTLESFANLLAFHQAFLSIPENKAFHQSPTYISRPFNSPAHAAFY